MKAHGLTTERVYLLGSMNVLHEYHNNLPIRLEVSGLIVALQERPRDDIIIGIYPLGNMNSVHVSLCSTGSGLWVSLVY